MFKSLGAVSPEMMDTDGKHMVPLLGALAIAMIPHVPRLPLWVVVWCLSVWGYILWALYYRRPLPGKGVRLVLTIGGIIGVLLTYGIDLSKDSGVALLWIMTSIKPMEVRGRRDKMVCILLAYFLALVSLFFSNRLTVGFCIVFSVFCTTTALIHIHLPGAKIKGKLALTGKFLLQGLPLAVILFFTFPRIQGSLWGIQTTSDAMTGFSDRLEPGSVSNLVRSKGIAFRVEFKAHLPGPDLLYWRGLVFEQYNGRSWHRSSNPVANALTLNGENEIEYTITLEPHNKRWLFALDLPQAPPPGTYVQTDYTLVSLWTIRQRVQYTARSLTSYNTGPRVPRAPNALAIPANTNPRAVALARKMRTESRSSEEVIQKALNFFGQNGFSYTLKPPLLGREAIDDFLFTTRKGYCEHFASAFAFLMRAAGVHARIVGGYLGGELNPYGDYLIVRHSDAHVWVETWLSGKGWVRVDPTTTVAPQRVAQGVAAALPPEERQAFSSLVRFGPFAGYLKAVLLGMDTLNNQWNRKVLGYSYLRQKALLDKFGPNIGNRPGLVRGFLIGVGLTGCLALFYLYRIFGRTTLKKDRVQQIYFAFCTKLERVGLARRPSQGPLDYAEIVLAARADLRAKVLAIVNLYIQLRYGRGGDADDLKKFRIMVKRFNPLKPPGGHQG